MSVAARATQGVQGVQKVVGSVRWWWLIRARYYAVGAGLLCLPFLIAADTLTSPIFLDVVSLVGVALVLVAISLFLVSFLAPLGVYMERKNLPKDAEWYPSRWYYLTIAPDGLLGLVLAFVYGRRRLRTHGNASYAELE